MNRKRKGGKDRGNKQEIGLNTKQDAEDGIATQKNDGVMEHGDNGKDTEGDVFKRICDVEKGGDGGNGNSSESLGK